MGMGFAPTWLRQVSSYLLHKTILTTARDSSLAVLVLRLGVHVLEPWLFISDFEKTWDTESKNNCEYGWLFTVS